MSHCCQLLLNCKSSASAKTWAIKRQIDGVANRLENEIIWEVATTELGHGHDVVTSYPETVMKAHESRPSHSCI